MVAFYVSLQFGGVDGGLLGRAGGTLGLPFGLPFRLAGLLLRGLLGIARVEFRPAGVAAGDAQGALQLAVGHVGRVGDGGRSAGEGRAVTPCKGRTVTPGEGQAVAEGGRFAGQAGE